LREKEEEEAFFSQRPRQTTDYQYQYQYQFNQLLNFIIKMGQCQADMMGGAKGGGKEKSINVNGLEDLSSGDHLEANYKLKKILGQGAFSTVREGVHKTTNHCYAVKCIKKQNVRDQNNLSCFFFLFCFCYYY
jgi:serine/threonine protein kinase